MVTTDPVDARLLGVVAEMGRAAVHEVAARLGMDPREVAARLVALSGSGLPLLVGVECDQNGLRAALARMGAPGYGPHGTPSGVYGGYQPGPQQHQQQVPPPHQVYAQPGPPSGPQHVPGPPSGQIPGPMAHGVPSGPYPVRTGPPSQPFPAQPVHQPLPPVSEAVSTWGPPQSSSWARGDKPTGSPMELTQPTPQTAKRRSDARTGKIGDALETEGLEGERLSVKLIEVVDPADYLFTAAGYRLQEGERSVVVHTELTNRGAVPFSSLPDLYLVLVDDAGGTISKAPVSLSSRPPHRIGVAPGETAGGHTVYVLNENTKVTKVSWSPRPDEESRTLTWSAEN